MSLTWVESSARVTSDHPELGPALQVKVVGAAMVESEGMWVHARLQDHAIPLVETLTSSAPLIFVGGTAMDTGKTWAGVVNWFSDSRELDIAWQQQRLPVLPSMRDVRLIERHGAVATATFTDTGIVCSASKTMAQNVKGIIKHLCDTGRPRRHRH